MKMFLVFVLLCFIISLKYNTIKCRQAYTECYNIYMVFDK